MVNQFKPSPEMLRDDLVRTIRKMLDDLHKGSPDKNAAKVLKELKEMYLAIDASIERKARDEKPSFEFDEVDDNTGEPSI